MLFWILLFIYFFSPSSEWFAGTSALIKRWATALIEEETEKQYTKWQTASRSSFNSAEFLTIFTLLCTSFMHISFWIFWRKRTTFRYANIMQMVKSPWPDNWEVNAFDMLFIKEYTAGSRNHTMTPKISFTSVSVDHRVILAFHITL